MGQTKKSNLNPKRKKLGRKEKKNLEGAVEYPQKTNQKIKTHKKKQLKNRQAKPETK
jgi:hypothetical protein